MHSLVRVLEYWKGVKRVFFLVTIFQFNCHRLVGASHQESGEASSASTRWAEALGSIGFSTSVRGESWAGAYLTSFILAGYRR